MVCPFWNNVIEHSSPIIPLILGLENFDMYGTQNSVTCAHIVISEYHKGITQKSCAGLAHGGMNVHKSDVLYDSDLKWLFHL